MKKYQSVYDRFWYTLDQKKVREAFCKFIENEFKDYCDPLIHSWLYDKKHEDTLRIIHCDSYKKICRATCFDYNQYSYFSIDKLIWDLFRYIKWKNLYEYVVHLQIIFDVLYEYKYIKDFFDDFVQSISEYTSDFPQLWLTVKIYKTKAPQLFPMLSTATNKKIENTLNILEIKQYKKTIAQFEAWMKRFITAKDILWWKNVIEDMRGACDQIIKDTLKNTNKGMKSVFGEPEKFGLNSNQKKIFEKFMSMMDDIKHWGYDPTKKDVVLIIGLIVDFIDFISSVDVNSKQTKSSKK